MAKYRRQEEPEETLTYAEEIQQEQAQSAPEATDNDEASFKKRYSDLRRYTQQLIQQKDQEISAVKQQLDTATKGQIKLPKTDDEIDQWSRKYPNVALIVDTIAHKRANEAMEEGDKRLAGLKQLETKLTRKDAEQQLVQVHPDFHDIRQDQSFHDWLAIQPKNIQDSLYKNNTDARAAARSIDLYKSDTGRRKPSGKRSAAQAVGRTSSSAPASTGKMKFSESQVSKMSDKDFEKHEETISESLRSGTFNYDLSGAPDKFKAV